MNNEFTAVELFAGAGGLGFGLANAGFKIVLVNEIEKDCAASFAFNHPTSKVLNIDIHEIDFQEEVKKCGLSAVTLVSGGPPCQGFSTVGSKNKKDARNSLFYEYLRVVAELNPAYILFENVAGFKRMYDGEAYKVLTAEIGLLGYDWVSSILEASDYGLPQKRHRTIIVGWKKNLSAVKLPSPSHVEIPNLFGGQPKVSLMEAISDLPPLQANDCADGYLCSPENSYQEKMRGNESVLTEHTSANYGIKMQEILSLIPAGGTVNDLPARLRPKSYFANTYARLVPDMPSPTITRNFGTPSSSRCVHPFQNRALSTREGARLQGFPDSYRFFGSKISKNLQIGNAVPPVFGEVIAREIIKSVGSRPYV